MSHLRYFPLVLSLSCLVSLGCEASEDEFPSYSCMDSAASDADLSGTWVITGSAERSECDDDELDGKSINIRSIGLTVTQNGDSLAVSTTKGQSKLTFSQTTITGNCVSFETKESGGPDGQMTYRFNGEFTPNSTGGGTIQGNLNGSGPGTCELEGSFEISVKK